MLTLIAESFLHFKIISATSGPHAEPPARACLSLALDAEGAHVSREAMRLTCLRARDIRQRRPAPGIDARGGHAERRRLAVHRPLPRSRPNRRGDEIRAVEGARGDLDVRAREARGVGVALRLIAREEHEPDAGAGRESDAVRRRARCEAGVERVAGGGGHDEHVIARDAERRRKRGGGNRGRREVGQINNPL